MANVCVCVGMLTHQSCPTLCDAMDCSLSGSSIPGILQAGILEWVAISFSNYYKAPHQIPQVGGCHFEDPSPLRLSLPGKAIELFFSTSPKTLSPSFDSALVQRPSFWYYYDASNQVFNKLLLIEVNHNPRF